LSKEITSMTVQLQRREFLAASAAAGVGMLTAGRLQAAPFKTTLKKALIGTPDEPTLTSWKAAGFEGIESGVWNASPEAAAAARKTADKLGMRIHSVLRGWVNFNSPDSSAVAKDIESVEISLQAAAGYGADAVLLVPCRVSGMPMPQPWEFDIELDEKTGHVSRVVAGDNAPYQKYLEAQNFATDSSRKAVERLIPVAEKAGVIIALENVWNNLWVKPALLANFIASFQCPWVQCYFDIGNHVKYALPEEWIRALGKLIVKCHVKDFKLNPDGHDGKFVDIRDGSVNWPLVRQELDNIGYNGWLTIEGSGGLSLEERNRRLDLIIVGA
jgi:hexulose-6-phosphate isomerase